MLALAEVTVLVGVLDKAIFHVEGGSGHIFMTFPAQAGVGLDKHAYTFRITGVQAAWSVTTLTAHSRLLPGASNTRQIVLIPAGTVTGCVTGPAGEG